MPSVFPVRALLPRNVAQGAGSCAVTALTATVHTKDNELVAIREDRDYWQRRAYHAEDALPQHSGELA